VAKSTATIKSTIIKIRSLDLDIAIPLLIRALMSPGNGEQRRVVEIVAS
jgi:hypothetical protein